MSTQITDSLLGRQESNEELIRAVVDLREDISIIFSDEKKRVNWDKECDDKETIQIITDLSYFLYAFLISKSI